MKKIVVIGGGESGYGAAVLAKARGFDVFVTDNGTIADKYKAILIEHEIPFEEGGHTRERIMDAHEAIKSPGIPDTVPLVQELRAHCIPVISEIEFAGRYLDGARTICVTGSNGKTTTATLIHQILKDAGYNAALGGNIGESFAYSVATGKYDWYVLELSSFQLDGMNEFRADIAVLTNITPDHLDRYEYKMQNYIRSKMRIVQNQTYDNYFIYSNDDPNILGALHEHAPEARLLPFTAGSDESFVAVEGHTHGPLQGAFMSGGDFVAVVGDERFAMPVADLSIRGIHNTRNAMAASMAAMAAGVRAQSIRRTLAAFGGIEHRLEYVGEAGGIEWINDSKATNVDSVWYALESMTRPVVWIAGGTDKGNDYSQLRDLAREKVKALVCMGVDNSKLTEYFAGVVPVIFDTHSIGEAMEAARGVAEKGDTVLLSPACASFDLFKNYEDRGSQFKEWVLAITN